MAEVLSVKDMSAGYGDRQIIKDLSFTLNDAEVLAVIGPNGSGKTTLLRAILGMMPVRSGRVTLLGGAPGAAREDTLAYLPQRLQFDRTFPISIREMLGLSLRTASPEAGKYIELLKIGPLLDKRASELSGGQMQRALLAYALIKEPRLLIMDEPTSWVDAEGADCVVCIMEEFKKRGIAMVIVTHDFSAVREVSTHVLGLSENMSFFERADSPELSGRLAELFGVSHHHGGRVACLTCHFPLTGKAGGGACGHEGCR